jgi:Viral coat protein P2 N-terminal domain
MKSPLQQWQLPAPQSQAAGKTNVFYLTQGQRYHSIVLEVGDTNGLPLMGGNLIGDIRLKLNGRTQRTISAVQLAQINAFWGPEYGIRTTGIPGTAGYRTQIPIWFSQPWRNPTVISAQDTEQTQTAWNATGLNPTTGFSLEVDVVAGVVNPVLGGFYEYDALTGGLGSIVKWDRQTFNAAGTKQDFAKTMATGDFLSALHIFPSTNGQYVNLLRQTVNGTILRDGLTTLENAGLLQARGLVPDISSVPRFDFVLDYDLPRDKALNTAGLNEFTTHLEWNASTSGTFDVVQVHQGPPS